MDGDASFSSGGGGTSASPTTTLTSPSSSPRLASGAPKPLQLIALAARAVCARRRRRMIRTQATIPTIAASTSKIGTTIAAADGPELAVVCALGLALADASSARGRVLVAISADGSIVDGETIVADDKLVAEVADAKLVVEEIVVVGLSEVLVDVTDVWHVS